MLFCLLRMPFVACIVSFFNLLLFGYSVILCMKIMKWRNPFSYNNLTLIAHLTTTKHSVTLSYRLGNIFLYPHIYKKLTTSAWNFSLKQFGFGKLPCPDIFPYYFHSYFNLRALKNSVWSSIKVFEHSQQFMLLLKKNTCENLDENKCLNTIMYTFSFFLSLYNYRNYNFT